MVDDERWADSSARTEHTSSNFRNNTMPTGSRYPSESSSFADDETGVRIRQVTSHPSIHHHPFYYLPAYDDGMQFLFFVSHRTGHPQLFLEVRTTGELVQLTDRTDLNEWSFHPSHDGKYVYFTAGMSAWRVETESRREELLLDFGHDDIREKGMVGAAMGTTTLSRDDRYWAVPARHGEVSRFHLIDTHSGKHEVILDRAKIGHPQFHPDDNTLLRYAGDYDERVRVIRRDGSEDRLVYERNANTKEWVVHETWRPGTNEILTTIWPHGVFGINVDSGAVREVTNFPAWHPMINRKGDWMVADTKNPDCGIHLFKVSSESTVHPLCASRSSNEGEHWNTDHCPYDDGPIDVYAPQHTHPHPNFSPDGRFVVFTSDHSGHAQIYEAEVGELECT